MYMTMESYRSLARNAAYAHRVHDVPLATAAFEQLWRSLDRENLSDHCTARAEFNRVFKLAYRERWEPGLSPAPAPVLSAGFDRQGYARKAVKPSPAPAINVDSIGVKAVAKALRSMATPRKSIAADCAAFFAKQGA